MPKFILKAEYVVNAYDEEEARDLFSEGCFEDYCITEVTENGSLSEVEPLEGVLIYSSEETCGSCESVFTVVDYVTPCPECGDLTPACNACVGMTDDGDCPIDCTKGSHFKEA